MIFGGGKLQELKNQAKADYERAVNSKEDSKEERAFKLKIGLRIRSCIDKLFVDGAEKYEKYSEVCLAAVASNDEKPPPPKASTFNKVRSVNGPIFVYLPEDISENIFSLGGKYQTVEIDAKIAIRRAQVIANQIAYDLDLPNKLVVLQFLRDELEEAGDPFSEDEEIDDNDSETEKK
ncbi:MAG: hypothetical protein CBC42_06090 [Betaproteobacteria bacterium TMED82]|nr:MAG: hypothetical protein CBC42_06090 [Betaproteobacteria bacterium TMED82]|tara:strand:+ start:64249 stop:64782 length:534 start_codon:yes stop_codon:yes gene_type:complete